MTDEPELTTFQKKLAERKAQEEAEKLEQERAKQREKHDEDLIPEHAYDRSESDKDIDFLISGIGILEAYTKYCGKMTPKQYPGQYESIKLSCPVPAHTDNHPSAWANTEKNTWYCNPCNEGGDVYDLAAIYHGMWTVGHNKPYKEGVAFHRLREEIAQDFGYVIQKTIGGGLEIIPPETEPQAPATESTKELVEPVKQASDAPTDNVVTLHDDLDEQIEMPSFDWRPICPPETFLDEYMKAASLDDVPEEYHFFHALIAIGFALGRDVKLFDSLPVYGNLFVCVLGRSGAGKSKSRRHLDDLLQSALPYDSGQSPPKGVKRIQAAASAEVLIQHFMKPVEDPTNPKKIAWYDPIRGLIDFNELSALVGRASRMGNVLKPALMSFYDMESIIATSSLTTGNKQAHQPFASALTTSQPRALRGLISQTDDASGFLNRWVFVTGKEKRRYSVGGVMVDMGPAIKPLQEIQAWASSFRSGEMVEWSTDALTTFDEWFQYTLEPLRKKAQNDLLIRMDLTIKKLILLFGANRQEKVISLQSVLDALYLYPYLRDAYGIPAGQINSSITREVTESVISQLKSLHKKTGKYATLRDLSRALYRKYEAKQIEQALDSLVKIDLVELDNTQQTGPGRRTKRYKYVGG